MLSQRSKSSGAGRFFPMLTAEEDDDEATIELDGCDVARFESGVRALKTAGCAAFGSGVLSMGRGLADVV